MSDYYKILGVAREASDEEIKKAFRELSMKHHPDRPTGNEEKFKEISEAYNTLSSPEKKKQYDSSFYTQNNPFNDFEEMFRTTFRNSPHGGVEFEFFSNQARRKAYPINPDIDLALEITIEDLYKGCQKKEVFTRQILCISCDGNGCQATSCPTCKGIGRVSTPNKNGVGVYSAVCRSCGGAKMVLNKSNPCSTCTGLGYKTEQARHAFDIPPGAGHLHQTMILNIPNLGNKLGASQGNLNLYISIKKQDKYLQDGLNLICKQDISVTDLCLGARFDVELPDKTSIVINIPAGTNPYLSQRVRGKGFKQVRSTNLGDLIVQLNLVIPKTLTNDQNELFTKLKQLGL